MTDELADELMKILMGYKPTSVEQLAEWIVIAARNAVDQDGNHRYSRLDHSIAYQVAQMMQMAKLKIPEKTNDR